MQFIDLGTQQTRIKQDIEKGISNVLAHGQYILGPEVKVFEEALCEFGQTDFAIGCANGTDALILPLMAWEVGSGDAVFCPSFTYCATAESIAIRGATPVFVDINRDTYNICAQSLRRSIIDVIKNGDLKPRAIIAVDLFGQSSDYPALKSIADEFDLKLIADSAQGFGTTLHGKHPSNWADISTTSFFPAKPLGCYGDGGAVMTNDQNLYLSMASIHVHGKGQDKYDNVRIGMNSRLDTLQAAILIPKIAIFADEIKKRNIVADRYILGLSNKVLRTPSVMNGVISTWAQFTIEVCNPHDVMVKLKERGIPTARYYPRPVHKQTAYQKFPIAVDGLLNTEECIDKVISLPMHPYLAENDQDFIIESIKDCVK